MKIHQKKVYRKINVITKSFSKECLIIINNVTDAKESRIICHLKKRQRHVKIQIIDKVCVS